ncbi:uncharacterized protein LOC134006268 [Scomber scombrus]|uniref:uncharacterized protein LOC134006268 n=1 Tax=Scomber scombrus TaxID=13677 RepID=UPI002DDAA3D3|nr:uncharacterized protein LOC134006268 [Scomber scombrus]
MIILQELSIAPQIQRNYYWLVKFRRFIHHTPTFKISNISWTQIRNNANKCGYNSAPTNKPGFIYNNNVLNHRARVYISPTNKQEFIYNNNVLNHRARVYICDNDDIHRNHWIDTISTIPQCRDEDCHCNGGECIFSGTLGRCYCHCQESVYGDSCSFGGNTTSANIDTGKLPTRQANVTLRINIPFEDAFYNLNSHQSVTFTNKLKKELEALCKEADPQAFKKVEIKNLTQGSVIAESIAEYVYLNNETQIQFVNTELDGVLTNILNDTNNLNKISQAFGDAKVQLNVLNFQPPYIKNVTDLEPFVNCSQFAYYTAETIDGQWQCFGPCQTKPDYCHQHGKCINDIHKGPICQDTSTTSSSTENNANKCGYNSAPTNKPGFIYNNNVLDHRARVYICDNDDTHRNH